MATCSSVQADGGGRAPRQALEYCGSFVGPGHHQRLREVQLDEGVALAGGEGRADTGDGLPGNGVTGGPEDADARPRAQHRRREVRRGVVVLLLDPSAGGGPPVDRVDVRRPR